MVFIFKAPYILKYCSLLILAIAFITCQAPVRGCLDATATNYNVAADEPCLPKQANCVCTYPQLIVSLTQALGDTVLYSNPQTINKQGFKLQNVSFFLSNIALETVGGTLVYVSDTIQIPIKKNATDSFTITTRNDIQLVSKDKNSLSIGTIRSNESFKALHFTVGLNDVLKQANYRRIARGTPLGTDSMYRKATYDRVMNQVLILSKATKKYTKYSIDKSVNVVLSFPKTYTPKFGYDFTGVNCLLDYAKWFNGIDFAKDDAAAIQKKIYDNTKNAFILK